LAAANIVICELGTTAGTATTGDVIVIPTTQTDPYADTVMPIYKDTTSDIAAPEYGMQPTFATTCLALGHDGFVLMAGSDEYMGTLMYIGKGVTTTPAKGTLCSVLNIKAHTNTGAVDL